MTKESCEVSNDSCSLAEDSRGRDEKLFDEEVLEELLLDELDLDELDLEEVALEEELELELEEESSSAFSACTYITCVVLEGEKLRNDKIITKTTKIDINISDSLFPFIPYTSIFLNLIYYITRKREKIQDFFTNFTEHSAKRKAICIRRRFMKKETSILACFFPPILSDGSQSF